MKSHELRLGNWVMGNKPYQIEVAQLVTMQYNENIGLLEYCTPIKLTENWLVDFRFVLYSRTMKHNIYIKNSDISVKIRSLIGSFYLYRSSGCIEIKYVHQLQNLYFALTGEELTLVNKTNNYD